MLLHSPIEQKIDASLLQYGMDVDHLRQVLFDARHKASINTEEYKQLSHRYADRMTTIMQQLTKGMTLEVAGNGKPTDINSDFDLVLSSNQDLLEIFKRLTDKGYHPEIMTAHGILSSQDIAVMTEEELENTDLLYMVADTDTRIDIIFWSPDSLKLTGTDLLDIRYADIVNKGLTNLPHDPEFTSLMRDPLVTLSGELTKMTFNAEKCAVTKDYADAHQQDLTEPQQLYLARKMADEVRTVAKSCKKIMLAIERYDSKLYESLLDKDHIREVYQESAVLHEDRAEGYKRVHLWRDEQSLNEMVNGDAFVQPPTQGILPFLSKILNVSMEIKHELIETYMAHYVALANEALHASDEPIIPHTPMDEEAVINSTYQPFAHGSTQRYSPSTVALSHASHRIKLADELLQQLPFDISVPSLSEQAAAVMDEFASHVRFESSLNPNHHEQIKESLDKKMEKIDGRVHSHIEGNVIYEGRCQSYMQALRK